MQIRRNALKHYVKPWICAVESDEITRICLASLAGFAEPLRGTKRERPDRALPRPELQLFPMGKFRLICVLTLVRTMSSLVPITLAERVTGPRLSS